MKRGIPVTTGALLTVFFAAGRPARAADPTMSECLAANEGAIKLRGEHKLRQARDEALVCSAPSCPGEVRDVCQLRVKDLNAAIPSIVFLAKDGAGHDLVAVRVFMDGEPIGDRLDGAAISVDPGQHVFTFEADGLPPVTQSFVVGEGQKDRREGITVGSAAASEPPPTSVPTATPTVATLGPTANPVAIAAEPPGGGPTTVASPPGTGQRIAGVAVGALGIVGLGLGGVFGSLAASKWSNAKAACNGEPASCTTSPISIGFQDEASAKTMATISTASFIAGGVLAASGIVVFLTAPKSSSSDVPRSARGIELTPTGGPGAAGMMMIGSF
jgi:hypothetical protein